VRYGVPALACGGIAGMPGIPGIDCIAGIDVVQHEAEQGQAQSQAFAAQAEHSNPQHPKTVEATIFNMEKFLELCGRLGR
jgi:hypothetical protein